MILNDRQIKALAKSGMIQPFTDHQVRVNGDRRLLSYGLSSYGYDLSLSAKDFRIFRHIPGSVVDPKRFNPDNLQPARLHSEPNGDRFFILPAHSYGLGVAHEKLNMPNDVTAIALGKSSLARVGVVANVTPAEAGWSGHLTLEFSNSSSADVRLYAYEGVIQLLFLKGELCDVTYADRSGKYQGQGEEVVCSRV